MLAAGASAAMGLVSTCTPDSPATTPVPRNNPEPQFAPRPTTPTPRPEIIRGVAFPTPVVENPITVAERTLTYSQFDDYEGGIIVNEHPNLVIKISRAYLNSLYNHPELDLKLPLNHKQFFVIFAEKDVVDLETQLATFKAARVSPIAGVFYPNRRIDANVKGLGLENVLRKERSRQPGASQEIIMQGLSQEITLNWYSALRSSLRYLDPRFKDINPDKIDDAAGALLLAVSPFQVLSIK